MALRKRPTRPANQTSPDRRVAALRVELDGLPALEAEALNTGDEEALIRIAARERIVRRELAEALVEQSSARRVGLNATLAEVNAQAARAQAREAQLEFAVAAYTRAVERIHRKSITANQRVLSLLEQLRSVDDETARLERAAVKAGSAVRNVAA